MNIATPRRSPRLSAAAAPHAKPPSLPSPVVQASLGQLLDAQHSVAAPHAKAASPQWARPCLRLARPLVAWDLEAQPRYGQQGLNMHHDRILEFGAIKRFADGRPDARKKLRFRVPFYVAPHVLLGHGIALRDYMAAATFAQQADEVSQFLDGCDFVGHYTKRFDIPLLGAALGRAQGKTWGVDFTWPALGTQVLDTWELFRRFVPDKEQAGGNYKLGTCYRFYTGKPLAHAHSAVADAQACMDVAHAMATACMSGTAVGLWGTPGQLSVDELADVASGALSPEPHRPAAPVLGLVDVACAHNDDVERVEHAACRA